MHNKLMEGPDPAHSLDANVAHSTKIDLTYQTMHRTSQEQKAQISSQLRVPYSVFPSFARHLWQRRLLDSGYPVCNLNS